MMQRKLRQREKKALKNCKATPVLISMKTISYQVKTFQERICAKEPIPTYT